jgi:chromosome segregation ATPase
MHSLESKIEEITLKVTKLIEQNAQYKRVVNDLKQRCTRLEAENQELSNELEENIENSASLDKESIKKQIDKYIQDIDLSIQWLSDLE